MDTNANIFVAWLTKIVWIRQTSQPYSICLYFIAILYYSHRIYVYEHVFIYRNTGRPLTPSLVLITTFYSWPALFNKIVTANIYWALTVCQRPLSTLHAWLRYLIITLNFWGRSLTPFYRQEDWGTHRDQVLYQRSYSQKVEGLGFQVRKCNSRGTSSHVWPFLRRILGCSSWACRKD